MKLNLLKSENTNKAILFSVSLSLLSKAFTFAQSLIVSYIFGTQTSTDILFYTLSTIILLTSFVYSINQQVLIPVAIDIKNRISEADSKKFIGFIYFIYLLIGLSATALLFISPVKAAGLLSKFPPADIKKNIELLVLVIPAFFFTIMNTFILDIFSSYKYFTLPMLIEMIKNIVVIFFVVFFNGKIHVTSLAAGIFAGNLIQFLILNVLMAVLLKFKFSFRYYKISAHVKKNMAYVVSGQLVSVGSGFVMMYVMSGYKAGVYTAMDYSQKINNLLASVVIGQILTVVGINIIEMYTKRNYGLLREVFVKYFKAVLFFIFPLCFILSLNSENVISLIFQRGKFDSDAVAITSGFFSYFILILPLRLVDGFIVRLIIAKQLQRISFRWHIFSDILELSAVLIMTSILGYKGYAPGMLAACILYVLLFSNFMLRRYFEFIKPAGIMKIFMDYSLLNIGISGIIYFALNYAGKVSSVADRLGLILLSALAYAVLYLAIGYYSGICRDVICKLCHYARELRIIKYNA